MEGRGSRGNRSSGRRERGPRGGNRHNNQGDGGELPEENVSRNGPELNDAQQQSWQHDLYDTRERRGGRRDPYQNGGGSRSGNNVLEGIERGIVCAVKDGFGFIESIDREADLFFHFTELPPDFNEEVKKGLEVEYQVATDRRSGKVSAVNLRILPPGSVVFEELSLDRYRGVVSKELSTKRQYQTEATGMIDTKLTDGSILGLPFAAHDIENSKLVLRNGDEVEFNILLQKKQQQQIATVIRVVKFAGERETGIVNNILEDKGFGFINCCDRDARLYFHFSELMCPEEGVTSGTEVEFTVAVDKRSDKISATRIFPLPKGTVTFETMLEERITGVVDTELSVHFDSRQKERREEPGIIVVKTAPSTASSTETTEEAQPSEEKKYFFRSKDLSESRMRLRPGDEVEFNPLIEKRTKKLFGTRITLIQAAPEVREQGVVASIKNSNGFITSVERLEEVAFHLSEFEDYKKQQRIEPGTEVEFAIVADNRSGKMRAVNIKVLPKGTVSFEEVIEGTHVGRVIKEATRGGRSGAKDEEGVIEYEEQEDGVAKKVQIPFPPKTALRKPFTSGASESVTETPTAQESEAVASDASDEPTTKAEEQAKAQALISASSSYLVPGDTVEFSIAVEKRTKARRATNLKLLEEAHLQREKGYVCKVKPKSFSGYLRSSTTTSESGEGEAQKPGEQYFFYYSDVKKSGKTREEVKLGLPVEFSVFPSASSSSQPRAVRIVVLQQELVAFEDVLEGPFHGVIEKDLRRKKSGPKESSPGIVAHILENGEKETLEYTEADVSERGLKLRVGESVDFTIAMDKFSKARRATNLKRGKQKGIVKSVKGSFGFIERNDKLAKEQLFFHMSRELTLRVGDEVEFMVVFNDKKEDINAQNIVRLKEGPEPVPVPSSSLSSDTGSSTPVKSKLAMQRKATVETPLVSILRNPRMPDPKSKGFSPEARAANGVSQAQPASTPAAPTPVVVEDGPAATPSSEAATV